MATGNVRFWCYDPDDPDWGWYWYAEKDGFRNGGLAKNREDAMKKAYNQLGLYRSKAFLREHIYDTESGQWYKRGEKAP